MTRRPQADTAPVWVIYLLGAVLAALILAGLTLPWWSL